MPALRVALEPREKFPLPPPFPLASARGIRHNPCSPACDSRFSETGRVGEKSHVLVVMRKSVLSAVVFPSLVVGLSLAHAQSPPGTRPEALRTALTVERDPAGNADLVLKTGRGYGYALETTPDLAVGNWSSVLNVYGLGQEARFRVLTNTNPPPGSTPTPPPIPSFTFQLVDLGNGDVLISWSEGGTLHSVVQTRVFPEILSPIWQQRVDVAPAGDGAEDYLLTLAALQVSYEPQATPPTNPPPTTTVLERLTDVWAQLDSGQTSGAGGASIPGTNASDFFRAGQRRRLPRGLA